MHEPLESPERINHNERGGERNRECISTGLPSGLSADRNVCSTGAADRKVCLTGPRNVCASDRMENIRRPLPASNLAYASGFLVGVVKLRRSLPARNGDVS
jgi:hypothetical protein